MDNNMTYNYSQRQQEIPLRQKPIYFNIFSRLRA